MVGQRNFACGFLHKIKMTTTIEVIICMEFEKFLKGAQAIMKDADLVECYVHRTLDKTGEIKGDPRILSRVCGSRPKTNYISSIIIIKVKDKKRTKMSIIHYNNNDPNQRDKTLRFQREIAREILESFRDGAEIEFEFSFRNCF